VSSEPPRTGWRVKLGFTMFIASISWPVFIPFLPLLGVSGSKIATFTGAMVIVAEVLLLAGAAIAGKDGFAFIKSRVFGLLRSIGPPREVGPARYRFGLVLFIVPLALGWAGPYFGQHIPGFVVSPLAFAIVGDVMLLVSLMLLGGDFWDKLRSLFLRGAKAMFPGKTV